MKKRIAILAVLLAFVLAGICPAFAGSPVQEEPVELIIETITFSTDNQGIPRVEEAVNEITQPLIGVRVKLLNITVAQHAQRIGQMITSGEPLDLVMAGMTYPVMSMAADGLLMPLNDLAERYGGSLQDIFKSTMSAGYIGDILYAVPAKTCSAMSGGLLYNTDMAREAGITVPDPCSLDDLDAVFAAVKECFPETYGTAFITKEVSMVNFVYNLETYGSGTYAFGVTFDPWENTQIVNLYASPQYRQLCEKMRLWQKKGYFPPNLMTSSVIPSERLVNDQIFCLFTGYSPLTAPGEQTRENTAMVQTTQAMNLTGLIQERMWGIPVTSAHPEEAMQFLNLLYTDTRLANLLMYGIEGVHYTKLSDHVIAHTENRDYQRVFTIFGDQKQIFQWYPATEDIYAMQEEFEQSAKNSATLGYVFDSSHVSREVEAVNDVIASYAPALECGLVEDVEGALNVFLEELEKAGIDRVITENRNQLNAWMEQNRE